MMRLWALVGLVVFSNPCWSQSVNATGGATATGSCNTAVLGNNNQLTIKCQGVSKIQSDKILGVLNKILANQLDPDAVMQKLDEILKARASLNQNCPNGICVAGDNLGTAIVNNSEQPYRHLTAEQRKAIKDLADSLPDDSSFLHIGMVNEPETLKYGNEIADFFRAKTKTIGVGLSYPHGMPEGVYVTIDSEHEPLFPVAQKIAAAFQACGIPVTFTKFETPTPGQIYITIGVRPEH